MHRGSKRMIKCGQGKQIKYIQGKLEEKNYDVDEKENMDDKRRKTRKSFHFLMEF
jgi:hypothetical protein